MRTLTIVLLLSAIAASGCQYPRDPDGTLNRVEGGVMRVGVTEADPWVALEGDRPVGGAEVPSPGVTVGGQDSSLSGSQ